jgi:hypothetical protein
MIWRHPETGEFMLRIRFGRDDMGEDVPVHEILVAVPDSGEKRNFEFAYVRHLGGGVVRVAGVPSSIFDEGLFYYRPSPEEEPVSFHWPNPP